MTTYRRHFYRDPEDTPESTVPPSDSPETEESTAQTHDPIACVQALQAKEEQLLRLSADFANKERRYLDRLAEASREGQRSVFLALMTPLDTLEKALSTLPEDGGETSWAEGFRQFAKQLEKNLAEAGCTKQEIILGTTPFDPSFHEAISKMPATKDFPAGTITQVYQQGYMLSGTLLRVSMVQVAE